MTTDTKPKEVVAPFAVSGVACQVGGMAKGAGMIAPNMATMLAFFTTDAAVEPTLLRRALVEATGESLNRITVDGDTSTNDSFILMATQRAGHARIESLGSAEGQVLRDTVLAVSVQLAQAIVRDGEGATKFITVCIEGGRDVAECRRVAYAIAHSPLVKTASFASDPNLGRILAAVGYAGIVDLDASGLEPETTRVGLASHSDEDFVERR